MHFRLSPPHRLRHPLARVLSLLLSIAMLGVLLVFGLALAGMLLLGGGLWLAWRQWKRPHMPQATMTGSNKPAPDVLEGEFVVIRQGPVAH